VKATTVPYDTNAQWLIVVTNTGTQPLADVTLKSDVLTGVDGVTAPSGCAVGNVIAGELQPQQSAVLATCVTDAVENVADLFSGADIVNTAQAQAVVTDDAGNVLPTADGTGDWTLTTNTDSAEVNTQLFAVGDYVWADANSDGQQSAGEVGVGAVVVNLLDSTGTQIATTTTDGSGYYHFDSLQAGTYQVQFVLPDGYMWTQALNGPTATDSDAGMTTGLSQPFTLGVGAPDMVASDDVSVPSDYRGTLVAKTVNPTIDAGVVVPQPNIKLTKWVCDSYDAAGAPTCTPWASLSGAEQADMAGIGVQAADGTWSVMQGVAPASSGWVKEASVPYNGTAAWMIVVTNIGNTPLTNVSVNDTVALQEAGVADPASQTLTVGSLDSGASAVVLASTPNITSTGTDASGDDKTPIGTSGEPTYATGTDVVNNAVASGTAVNPSTGEALTKPDGTPADAVVSNPSNAEVNTVLYAVGNYVWIDTNQNGIQDNGEVKLAGVTVNLLDSTGKQIETTTTDANGYYYFDKLCAGTYQMQFILPAGYEWTTADSTGSTDADNSDANQATGLTAMFTLGPNAADMVASTDAADAPWASSLTATVVNPTIDAGVVLVPVVIPPSVTPTPTDTPVTTPVVQPVPAGITVQTGGNPATSLATGLGGAAALLVLGAVLVGIAYRRREA